MSRNHHILKCETEYYQAQEKGNKSFEIRKNDRNFKMYDMVELVEVVDGKQTGRRLQPKEIVYIIYGGSYGLDIDYCIFQLK